MEVLLLTNIPGVGKKNDLIVVKSGFALNFLLPQNKAMVVTPNVRRVYAEQIKQRALEREREREVQSSLTSALSGKVVHVSGKASKAGKLYAAISETDVSKALKKEYSIDIPAASISIDKAIKAIGKHTATISVGTQSVAIAIEVKADEAEAKKA
jgi:large subunit ribosomal protein L9